MKFLPSWLGPAKADLLWLNGALWRKPGSKINPDSMNDMGNGLKCLDCPMHWPMSIQMATNFCKWNHNLKSVTQQMIVKTWRLDYYDHFKRNSKRIEKKVCETQRPIQSSEIHSIFGVAVNHLEWFLNYNSNVESSGFVLRVNLFDLGCNLF